MDKNSLEKLQIAKNTAPGMGGSKSITMSPTLPAGRANHKKDKKMENDYFKAVGKNRTRIRTRQLRDSYDNIQISNERAEKQGGGGKNQAQMFNTDGNVEFTLPVMQELGIASSTLLSGKQVKAPFMQRRLSKKELQVKKELQQEVKKQKLETGWQSSN